VGSGAAAITRVADESLVLGGNALLAAQVQRAFRVIIEHGKVMNCVGGHADQIPHRQLGPTAGSGRCRHRDGSVDGGVCGLVEFGEGGGDDHRYRVTAMHTEVTGGDRCAQTECECIVAALRRGAVVALGGVACAGLVAARPYRRLDCLEISASLRIEPTG
jgi:hypothetical protein